MNNPQSEQTSKLVFSPKAMVLEDLEKHFPFLTKEQATCLREGRPLPASPEYVNLANEQPRQNPVAVQAAQTEIADMSALLTRMYDLVTATDFIGPKAFVTAILVISDPARFRRARRAIAQFMVQTYPYKRLVVVNASGVPLTDGSMQFVQEVMHPTEATVGELRNIGIQKSVSAFIYPCWDDDDVYDPYLLSYMMRFVSLNRAVALSTQIRVDVDNSNACYHTEATGIPNTMLVPRTDAVFDHVTGGEDESFWQKYYASNALIIGNNAWPTASLKLSVRFAVGVVPIEKFMSSHPNPKSTGAWLLHNKDAMHIRNVFARVFGLNSHPTESKKDNA